MESVTRTQVGTFLTVAAAIAVVIAGWFRPSAPQEAEALRAGAGLAGGSRAEPGLEISHTRENLIIHVAGAVKAPGIYRLPPGSRAAAAIAQAGGTNSQAAPGAVNLAAPLADGQQLIVPSRITGAARPGTVDAPVSLSSATANDLEEIDGIGPVTAERILEFRDQNGGVAAIDELDAVSGIGPATLETLREAMTP